MSRGAESDKIEYVSKDVRKASLAEILTAFVKSSGILRYRIAERLGIPAWRLSLLLTGKPFPIDEELYANLANLLDRPISEVKKLEIRRRA